MSALMVSLLLTAGSGALSALFPGQSGLHSYAVLRFLTGMGGIGCFMSCFVLAVEHVGHRSQLNGKVVKLK